MAETRERLGERHNAGDDGRKQREERAHVVAESSLKKQTKYRDQKGEQEDLVECHHGVHNLEHRLCALITGRDQ